jgi:glycosyltransferase involved in cell wall biosynthesis
MTHDFLFSHYSNEEKHGLVSIIVPVYKAEKFIKKCIDSLLCQTYPNIEIIVVYDESPDNTLKILEGYGNKIKLIKQGKTSPAIARNVGLSNAKGKYIAFCDADDFFAPDKIEKQINVLNEYRDIGFVYTDIINVNIFGEEINRSKSYEWNRNRYLYTPAITFSSVVMKKEILDRLKEEEEYYFDEQLPALDDIDFLIRVSAITKFKRLPDFLTYRISHSDGLYKDWHKMNIIRAKIEWKHRMFQLWARTVFFLIPKDQLVNRSPTLKKMYEFVKKLVIR